MDKRSSLSHFNQSVNVPSSKPRNLPYATDCCPLVRFMFTRLFFMNYLCLLCTMWDLLFLISSSCLLCWNFDMCVLQMTYVDFCRAILCVFITVVIQCSFLFPHDFYIYLLTFFLRYLNINIDKFWQSLWYIPQCFTYKIDRADIVISCYYINT